MVFNLSEMKHFIVLKDTIVLRNRVFTIAILCKYSKKNQIVNAITGQPVGGVKMDLGDVNTLPQNFSAV